MIYKIVVLIKLNTAKMVSVKAKLMTNFSLGVTNFT